MRDFATKSTGSSLSAAEFNDYIVELENFCTDSGQTLASGDPNQLGKSGAAYGAGGGDFYEDSGAADVYDVAPFGSFQSPEDYFEGMRVRFKPDVTNTGASTIDVNSLGVKNIKDTSGNDPGAGDLFAGDYIELIYDDGSGFFRLMPATQTVSQVQDYVVVAEMGTALQQQCGWLWDHTILDALLSASATEAYYKFANGALTTDETGTFTLTNNNAAINANGIMGTAFATTLDGVNQSYNVDALLDLPQSYVNGISIEMFVNIDDGQPATDEYLFYKVNVPANDIMSGYIDATGLIAFDVWQGGVRTTVETGILFANAVATGLMHLKFTWDTTNGVRIFKDRKLVAQDGSLTTLPADDVGAGGDFYIGSTDTPGNWLAGTIAQFKVSDELTALRDVDILTATILTEPAALTGKEYTLTDKIRVEGDTSVEYQRMTPVVAKSGSNIYRKAFVGGTTDTIKTIGRT